MIVKFLGTSSGEAIPRTGCDCAQCASIDKKDKRRRATILINKKILIDAGPDITKELRKDQIEALDTVIITHDHRDHSGGLNDILKINKKIRVIRPKAGQHFKLDKIDYYAFKVKHSQVLETVGLEIGPLIYIPDFAEIDWALKYLKESKVAVLDGSVLGRDFAGHLSINKIISETKNLRNLRKIYFTHNGHTRRPHKDMVKLVKALGDERFSLAFDGLELKI